MPRTTRPLICGGIVYDNSAKIFYQPGVQLLYLGLSLLCAQPTAHAQFHQYLYVVYTVEPLYYRHPWANEMCPD